MALTQQQRIDISKDLVSLPQKVEAAAGSNDQIDAVKSELQKSDDNLKVFFDKFNNQANNYFEEHKWLDGTTYTELLESQIQEGAQRLEGNIFFATDGSWTNFQPEVNPPCNATPISPAGTFSGNELEILNRDFDNDGIEPIIDFILNGQSSAVSDDTTLESFSGGNGVTIEVNNGGQTVGNLVIIDSGSDSALCRITAVTAADPNAGTCSDPQYTDQTTCETNGETWTSSPQPASITVDTIIAPAGTLAASSTVRENITGYTNSERETLTTTFGENVLVGLKDKLVQAVLDWELPVTNSSLAIDANTRDEVTAPGGAKETTDNTKSIIDTWQSKTDSGVDGKLVNGNIDSIETEANFRRVTYISNRVSEIPTALGSVSSASDGSFSGNGVFFDRFNQINSRINLAGGPLTEFYEKDTATKALEQIENTATAQLSTFQDELLAELIVGGGQGTNQITVAAPTGLSVSDSIFVVADGLTELSGTIQNIEVIEDNTIITLSFIVSVDYTSDLVARIYKQL